MTINPRTRSFALVAAALIAACQPAASGPMPSAGTSATPSSSPASVAPTAGATDRPLPTVALGPAVTLRLDTSGPIVRSTDGPASHRYALPAAGASDGEGGYLLFIVWFAEAPGDQIVTVARSKDGHAWTLGKEAIFTDLGMDLAHPGPIPATARREADGTWRMFGWAAHETDSRRFSSWRASAPKPEGPWALDKDNVIEPGAPLTWDSQTAAVAEVQPTANGYGLWYEGQGPGSGIRGDIGYATSTDGLTWTKFNDPSTTDALFAESDPVMHHGMCGPASSLSIYQPQVEVTADGFVAVVGAFGPGRETMDLFGATSTDGVTWLCGSETPILRAEDIPGSQGIHTIASMPMSDGRVGLILESLGDKHSDLWLATVEVAQ